MIEGFARTAVVVAMLATTGCGASPYYAGEPQKAFLPTRGPVQRLGEFRLMPGERLFETPVGFREAVTLDAGVGGTLLGKPFAMPAGGVLVRTFVAGQAAAGIPRSAVVLCGTATPGPGPSPLAAGLIGAAAGARSGGMRVCLIDGEGDGRAERAFSLAAKRIEDAAPVAIEPAAYTQVSRHVMPGESAARLTYAGKPGKTGGSIGFDLSVVEEGRPLVFNNTRTAAKLADLPKRLEVMGAAFTVKSYDPADGSVVVAVERGFNELTYGLTMRTTTTYIPIHVPH